MCPPDTRAQTLRAPGLSRKSHGAPGVPLGGAIVLRVLACTRSSRDAWLRKSHAASRRLALGLPSSRCGVCCPRAALASMHAPRPGCPALLPAPQAGFPTLRSGRACWSQSLRVRGTFVPFSTQFLVELSVGSLPLSVCICYTSFALVAEILRKGGGAFDAIPMDHFYTMRDLQEWVARHRTVSGRSESLSVSSTILRPSLASPYSSKSMLLVFKMTFPRTFL